MCQTADDASRPSAATAGGDQPDAAAAPTCADCPLERVFLRRVELFFHNDSQEGQNWPRDMFPFSSDPITVQAIVWATTDESDSTGQPYAFWPGCNPTNPYEYFNNDGYYCCLGRGIPGDGRIDRQQARPDIHRPRNFVVPGLEIWRNHRLDSALTVQLWPNDRWPYPQFTWNELPYETTRCSATAPRPYYYSSPTSLSPASGSEGWALRWTAAAEGSDSLSAGIHRLGVVVQLGEDRVTCPRNDAERDAGCALHLPVREGILAGPDANVQQLAAQNLPHPLPDSDPAVVELLRWASIFLEAPYEVGGKWFGGKSTGGQSVNTDSAAGYQGYGLDCTGLPSTARALLDQAWGNTYPEWRRSTHGQGNPLPGFPLYDRWNGWRWTAARWVRQPGGAFNQFTRDVLGYVQPGDVIDTGSEHCRVNHIRLIYRVIERTPADRPTDATVDIIEAASSEAGKVRIESGVPVSRLVDAEPNQYGLWRPLASHPARPEWLTDGAAQA